jgi:hypothetical protein
MKRLAEIRGILREHRQELAQEFKVRKAGIFGSYARGEQRAKSDLDILVEFRSPVGLFQFLDLEERLRRLLGVKVDLVSKKALKPRIGRRILQEVVYI